MPSAPLPTGAANEDALIILIGSVLLRDNQRDDRMRQAFALGEHPINLSKSSADAAKFVATTRALVTVMIDDLHVHRLRQVWLHIATELGAQSAQMPRSLGDLRRRAAG